MMLSFSMPSMRPMIEAGLRERAVTGFPPSREGASADRPAAQGGSRTKRQTIRHRGPVWQRMIAEAINGRVERDLHLWWKSRSSERELLGVVRGFHIEAIAIENCAGDCLIHRPSITSCAPADGSSPSALPDVEFMLAHAMARDDGFEDFAAFARYFAPNPGDRFAGALIKW